MRVTSNSMFQGLINQVSRNMSDYHKYNEMISTERRINKISDDPAGLATALKHRGNSSAYQQYSSNIKDGEEFLRATDSALSHLQDVLVRAREIAETTATETASQMEKEVAAEQIQQIIDEALGIANTKMRDRYLFAGTNGEQPAYSLNGRLLTPLASTGNVYNNTVTAEGSYDGTAEFIVKFSQAGSVGDSSLPTTAKYQISHDGGATWSDEQSFTNLTIPITDQDGNNTGLTMTFNPEELGVGDEFRLQVVSGKYMGDEGHIEFNNNAFSRVKTNVNGKELFEDTKFFDSLYQLKNALEHGNNIEISAAIGHLDSLQSSMQTLVTSSGMALNRLEISKNNLTSLQENVIENIQNIEKVDVVEVLTRFAMTENALNSSVAALSKVFPKGLLSYI